MFQKITEFLRNHVWGAMITAVISSASLGAGAFFSMYESRYNRVEDLKVVEFNTVMTESGKFLEMLAAFTEEVGSKGVVDPQKRRELSASLARLYTSVGIFAVNLPADQSNQISSLQTSVNEVKKRVQLTKKKNDLDPLSVALADFFIKMKAAKPIFETAVGKGPEMSAL